jgi:phosphatidylinositol phospholipase C delta
LVSAFAYRASPRTSCVAVAQAPLPNIRLVADTDVIAPPVPIENIRELRTGADARFNRQQFQISQEYEPRWITIIYTLDGRWKTLHAIAPSTDVFQMWDTTMRQLYGVRKALMAGTDHADLRETLWERQCWKGADEQADQRLYFEDVEKLCKRLSISPSKDDLMRRFQVRPPAVLRCLHR